jgi:hypothetical protein
MAPANIDQDWEQLSLEIAWDHQATPIKAAAPARFRRPHTLNIDGENFVYPSAGIAEQHYWNAYGTSSRHKIDPPVATLLDPEGRPVQLRRPGRG